MGFSLNSTPQNQLSNFLFAVAEVLKLSYYSDIRCLQILLIYFDVYECLLATMQIAGSLNKNFKVKYEDIVRDRALEELVKVLVYLIWVNCSIEVSHKKKVTKN